MSEEERHVKPIDPKIRPVLEEFLAYPEYQQVFMEFARRMGYEGNDINYVKTKLLFIPNEDGEIMFNIQGLYDLFLEFQLIKQLKEREPYRSLLERKPSAIAHIRDLAKNILEGNEISNEDIQKIFEIDNGSIRRDNK